MADESANATQDRPQCVTYMLENTAPPGAGNDEASKYIDGIVSRANKMLILVDLNKRLSEAEWGQIAE